MMKKALLMVTIFLLVGCAYIAPTYVPKATRNLYKDVMGHEVPNYKGFSTLGILDATDKELDFRKNEYLVKWTFVKQFNTGLIEATKGVANSILGLLALTGPIGAAVAHKVGLNTKRPEDYTEAEYQAALKTDPKETV